MRTLEDIDRRIAILQHEIMSLRHLRNSLCPINKLPPEILTFIFSLVAKFYKNASWQVPHIEWILVTHVCRWWRITALECKPLWTDIFIDQRYTRELIKRSGDCPISLTFGNRSSQDLRQLSVVLQELPRIQCLRFCVSPLQWSQITSHLIFNAPALESLVIQGYTRCFEPAHVAPTVPYDIFSEMTPMLRRLSLDSCDFSFDSSLFKNLTSLTVTHPRPKHPFSSVHTALQRMPFLRTLHFASVLSPPQQDINSYPIIKLPQLTFIKLDTNGYFVTSALLSRLSYNPRARVVSQTELPSTVTTAFTSLLGVDAVCRGCMFPELDLEYFEGGICLRGRWPGQQPKFDASMTWDDPTSTPILDFHALPKHQLVIFNSDMDIDYLDWKKHISHLPTLQQLLLFSKAVNSFLRFLLAWFSENICKEDSEKDIPCRTANVVYLWLPEPLSQEFDAFLDYLRARVAQGVILERLFLSPTFFENIALRILKPLIISRVGHLGETSVDGADLQGRAL